MKKKLLLLLLSPLLLAMTCDDDETVYEPIGLEGGWTMVHVKNGLAGVNNDVEEGRVVWTFDENTNKLVIAKTNEDDVYDGPAAGTYAYYPTAIPEVCDTAISLESLSRCVIIEDDVLTVTDEHLDGDTYTFTKQN